MNFRFFPTFRNEIETTIGHCKNLLDVGCGSNSPIQYISKKPYCVGVDAFKPSITRSNVKKIHDDYFLMNILEIDKKFKPNSFECVVAFDLIEHLKKDEGYKLLDLMERISNKTTIIFTPNGFVPQSIYEDNPWQVHKSGWTVKEMQKRGYKVIGMNGWKILKGEYAVPRYRPRLLWYLISEFSQIFVKNHPEKAFHLLCVKENNLSE